MEIAMTIKRAAQVVEGSNGEKSGIVSKIATNKK
jgi:hypothetical protein